MTLIHPIDVSLLVLPISKNLVRRYGVSTVYNKPFLIITVWIYLRLVRIFLYTRAFDVVHEYSIVYASTP